MKRFFFTVSLVMALMGPAAFAQDFNQTEAIKEQMASQDAKTLSDAEDVVSKAEQQLDQVNAKFAQADKLRNQASGLKKGKAKKLIKQAEALETPLYAQKIAAFNKLEKANSTIYGIYAADLTNLAKTVNDKKQMAAKSMTDESTQAWTSAMQALDKVPTGKSADPKSVVKYKEDAYHYQQEAIGIQIQQYAMLLGWFEKNEVEESKPQVVAPQETKRPDRIIFKVQIAASYVPLSLDTLKQIYAQGQEIINNELENNVYKYSVGYYNTYEEAYAAKKRINVKGAFVVCYKNGVKIRVEDIVDDKWINKD